MGVNKENITEQELMEIIGEEIGIKIKNGDIDSDALVEIASDLEKKGVPAGDERRTTALEILRQRMIDEELKKRAI